MDKLLFKILCSIVSFLTAFNACAQTDSVFATPYPERYLAVNNFIEAGGDSATDSRRTKQLLERAKQTNDERDILNIERAILVIDHMWHVDTAHILDRADQLIKKARKIDCHPVIAFVYNLKGDYYYYYHDYVRAFEYYLRCYNYYHNLYRDEFPDMSETQYGLAAAYYKFGDYDNSLRYSKDLTRNIKRKPWLNILIHDIKGTTYLKLNQYDSARVHFEQTLELAPSHHHPKAAIAWQGIAKGKIGVGLYKQKKYEEAVNYLQQGITLTTDGEAFNNTASFAVCLADIYLSMNNIEAAKKNLQIARAAASKANDLENYTELYTAYSTFYRHTGNTALTLNYQDSALKYKDSLAAILDVNKKYVAELRVADERRNMGEDMADEEKAKQILIRNLLIVIVLLLMAFTLLFYNRRLLQQKYQRQQLLAEKHVTEAELANAVGQLDAFRKNIAEKNELITNLEKELVVNSDPTIINKLQQSTILTDEEWENFRELFEKVHPGFMQSLKEKLSGLSPAETRFMVLAKLSFSNKEMAAILGVSSQAIRTTWYRLRKKLNLPEEGTIEDLVEKI